MITMQILLLRKLYLSEEVNEERLTYTQQSDLIHIVHLST